MAQETRKDPRAKVLTVTVRYKSATLDEFIEHHSHDVSRGGMFIKTVSPFPPGTLLKIEVRIAGDQRVMQGVGRVVWKRESGEAQDGSPAGMGVKFIKIDDASRGVIDQLVSRSGGAVSAFDKGSADQPAAAAAAAPTPAPAPVAASDSPKLAAMRKGTMIGLGSLGSGAAEAADTAPPEEKPGAFFPDSPGSASEPPPEDRTVMKQAAELLQDALREAGGSLDEVGTPTIGASGTPGASAHPPAPVHEPPRPGKSESPPKVEEKAAPPEPEAKKPVEKAPEKAAAASRAKPTSSRPAGTPRSEPRPSSRPASSTRRAATPAETIPVESGGSGKITAIVLAIAVVGGGLYLLTRTPPEPPAPAEPPAAVAPEPAPTPTPVEAPTAAAPSEPMPPPVALSALPEASAPAATATAAPPAPPVETITKKPKPASPTPVSKPAAPTTTAPSEPAMTAAPKPTAAPPVATATATTPPPPPPPTATTAPAPAPTPKPTATAAPKPKAPSASDNPF
jgi:uncharacterized protein (TIGR02266 family)